MRLLASLLLACAGCAASEVAISQWNGMLLVTAPAGRDVGQLAGRLDQRITLDARDQSLTDTADVLRSATGLNVVVAPALLARPPLVNMQVRDMALGNVLHWLERVTTIHVGFISGALYLSDQPMAGDSTTRLYDVSDLVAPVRNFPGPDLAIPLSGGTGARVIAQADETDSSTTMSRDELVILLTKRWR